MDKIKFLLNKLLRDKPTSLLLTFSFVLVFITAVNGISLVMNINYREKHEKISKYNGNRYNFFVTNNVTDPTEEETNRLFEFVKEVADMNFSDTNILDTDVALDIGNTSGISLRTDVILSYNTGLDEKLIQGNMPDKSELSIENKFALVNINSKDIVQKSESGEIIKITGEYYKVSGYYECDEYGPDVITFYDCLSDDMKIHISNFEADGDGLWGGKVSIRIYGNNKSIAREEIEKTSDSYGYVISENISVKNTRMNPNEKLEKIIMVLLYVFCIIDSIAVCNLWLNARKRNFVIMKAAGISSVRISLNTTGYILVYSVISFAISMILQSLISRKFVFNSEGVADVGQLSLLITGSVMVVVIVMLIVSFIKITRIVPARDIRK